MSGPPSVYLAGPDVFLPDSAGMLEGPMLQRERTIVRVAESGPGATAAFAAFEIVVPLAAVELGA